MTTAPSVPLISSGILNDLSEIHHAFFTRQGGVSEGIYESLNCGPASNDDPARVKANRDRAMARLKLPPEALVTPRQIHGTHVEAVGRPWPQDEAREADGLVTRVPGIALGVLAADCAPVLFADDKAGVVAVAHAGWKGALAGILEACVEAMTRLGASPENTRVVIGPCISQWSYKVDLEFLTPFISENPSNEMMFSPSSREDCYFFDYSTYIFNRLDALGLNSVSRLPHDTCGEAERFFSYRRSYLEGETDFGRNLSVIFLKE